MKSDIVLLFTEMKNVAYYSENHAHSLGEGTLLYQT